MVPAVEEDAAAALRTVGEAHAVDARRIAKEIAHVSAIADSRRSSRAGAATARDGHSGSRGVATAFVRKYYVRDLARPHRYVGNGAGAAATRDDDHRCGGARPASGDGYRA